MANHDLWERSRQRCEQHPELRPLPGVCSSCLRAKLQDLFVDSNNRFSWSSSFHTSSSSNFSDWSSPPREIAGRPDRHRRNGSAAELRSVSVGNHGGIRGGGLRKSRSVAVVARTRSSIGAAGDQTTVTAKKKKGFWAKLIHFKSTPRDPLQPATARIY